jgi:hypothetical protein
MTSKDKSAVPSDLEIMMFLDGELHGDEADAVARFLEESEEAKAKATSLGQMSELMQASIELDADDAADRLDGLWSGIDKAIHDNGVSKPVSAVASVASAAEDKATDALVAKVSSGQGHGWFGAWQSHIMTGAFVAVAVAVLMIATRPDPAPATQPQAVRPVAPIAVPVTALASQDPEVEELEVYDGSGVIMTMPGDEEEGGDSASTVIWISNDTDLVEDPI